MSEHASGNMGRLDILKNRSEQNRKLLNFNRAFIKHNTDICLPEENPVTFLLKTDLCKFQSTQMIYCG